MVCFSLAACAVNNQVGVERGKIISVEDNGMFFKTTTVFLKTNNNASDLRQFCLESTAHNYNRLKRWLIKSADKGRFIIIHYHHNNVFTFNPYKCKGDESVIDGIE